MIFASLIFAATISTQSNRNFMRTPEWVPETVSAENTYGTAEHMANKKARRLGAKDIAAIASIFDAFYERAYFGSVGPSNNWTEAADDNTGINVFKVGRNFDFFYKGLGDTNNTGLVMTDTHRLVEYENLRTFFTKAYNNFLSNDGKPLLKRSTWETDNRRQYWSCSRMPKTKDPVTTSIENNFATWIWGYGSSGYNTGPTQQFSFMPLAAMNHIGALWSDGAGQNRHIVHSLLTGGWSGTEIVYGEDDLARILPTGETYGFYKCSPSDLFHHMYELGTNGICEADFSRRLLPDICKDVEWNWFEPGKYSARTNFMWSVPAALTLAASSLDTTIEELKLIEPVDERNVIVTTWQWESENIYHDELMLPWEHLKVPVRIHMEMDDDLMRMVPMATIDTHSCPLANHVSNYVARSAMSTNYNVYLPKNYATYRFSGMLPGNPIKPRIKILDAVSGIHTNEFDFLEKIKTRVIAPELAGRERVPMMVYWYDNVDTSAVECWIHFPFDVERYDTIIDIVPYEDLWVKDEDYELSYDAWMDLKGSYSVSYSLPTAKESSYYFATPPQCDRLDKTIFPFAAAELFRIPTMIGFIDKPFTIGVESPVPLEYSPGSRGYKFYREYCFGDADSVYDVFEVLVNRCFWDNVIGKTLGWTPGFNNDMKPENMLKGTMTFSADVPLTTRVSFHPEASIIYVNFDEDGSVDKVYKSEDAVRPMQEIIGTAHLHWSTGDLDQIAATAEVEQLEGLNIRPPVEIDDRAGILMKNTWNWKACRREDH